MSENHYSEVILNATKTDHGPVILTEWVLGGSHCPVVEVWEDEIYFYQFHRPTKNTRKAEKRVKESKYGEWYVISGDKFKEN